MRTYRTSVRTLAYGTTASLVLLIFSPLRSFCGENAHCLSSLTVDQRNHLPDNTSVALPWGRTVTLGKLRAEHRARMERFSKAAEWGKAAAARLTKPAPPASASSRNSAPAPQPPRGERVNSQGVANSSALGQPNSSNTAAAKNAVAPPNSGKGSAKMVTNAAASSSLFLVPRQGYPGVPIPRDYLAFCNAAQASACIYLPPNANFVSFKYLPNLAQAIPDVTGNPDRLMADVDVLMTDQPLCQKLGGMWSTDAQACAFIYFSVQQTTFKPAGTPASAASCNPQADYRIDPKRGTILAEWSPPPYFDVFQTDATAITCVVQEWLYP